MSNEFALRQYTLPLPQPFEASESLQDFGTPKPGSHHDESWPVLYILTNSKNKTAYIGQTTNYQRRMRQHAANADKDFDRTLLIDNPTFNQSATFEFENRLIELFCADEKYQVTNANNGYAQFDYFERPQYRQKFRTPWTKLREENYAIHPIEDLENTDLFKFSPFKTLTPDQYETIEAIYKRLEQEHEDVMHGAPKRKRVTVVNGAPGTGKTEHGLQRKRGRVIPWDGDETAPLRPAGQHIGKPAQAAAEVWTSQQFRSQRLPLLPLLS